jgi:hypothetical protein
MHARTARVHAIGAIPAVELPVEHGRDGTCHDSDGSSRGDRPQVAAVTESRRGIPGTTASPARSASWPSTPPIDAGPDAAGAPGYRPGPHPVGVCVPLRAASGPGPPARRRVPRSPPREARWRPRAGRPALGAGRLAGPPRGAALVAAGRLLGLRLDACHPGLPAGTRSSRAARRPRRMSSPSPSPAAALYRWPWPVPPGAGAISWPRYRRAPGSAVRQWLRSSSRIEARNSPRVLASSPASEWPRSPRRPSGRAPSASTTSPRAGPQGLARPSRIGRSSARVPSMPPRISPDFRSTCPRVDGSHTGR